MSTEKVPAPPVAPTVPVRTTLHDDVRVDDYAWLRDRDDPRTRSYLEAENAHTDAVLAHTEGFREALYEEMLSRIQETDTSAPVPYDGWLYYQRTEEGKQYPIFCRRRDQDDPEEVLLDENLLAEGHDYHAIGVFDVSDDHRWLAYAEDVTGAESYTLRIKDLHTGELLDEAIEGVYYGSAWCNDSQTLYYTLHDEAKRPYRLMRHRLGTDPGDDELVFEESDDAFFLQPVKTRSRGFVLIHLGSSVTSEVHLLAADDPRAAPRVVEPRRPEIEYDVEHHGDRLLIRTNDDAKNFRLMEAPVDAPGRENWTEVVPHREDVKLADVEAFAGHLVRFEREEGLGRIRVQDLQTSEEHTVELPEPVYGVWIATNEEFDTTTLRFVYTSLATPMTWFDYRMDTREMTLVKRQPVLGGYDPDDYVTERLFAEASDGTRIPISLVHRKGLSLDGGNPLWLYGYGSYGSSIDPHFQSIRLSLVDRGFVFAIAHVRGGGELGERWHDDGKMLNKRNTFDDFIACAEHLVATGYTSTDRMVAEGGSAGGLLMGAVANNRPDLFFAIVAAVPFVDVLNTILDPSLPLTVIEWEEWGNPNDPEFYRYIRSYSPYDNVIAQDYPNMLVLGGLHDPRVHYWEPAKWVAKLRATKTDDNRILLRTNMDSGHGGPSGRYDYLREKSFTYTFVLDLFDLTDPERVGVGSLSST